MTAFPGAPVYLDGSSAPFKLAAAGSVVLQSGNSSFTLPVSTTADQIKVQTDLLGGGI